MKSPFAKDVYHKNATLFKILANPKRLEILSILKKGESSVERLIDITKLSKANMSQHLAVLRHNGFIEARREGLHVYYTLCDSSVMDFIR